MNTDTNETIAIVRQKYQVESVVKADAPEGLPGDNWHRYTITYGKTNIHGMMPGSLFNVTQHAKEFAESLNERSGKFGSTAAATRTKKK